MIKVLFICHGNICRSTMAQFVFQHMVNEAAWPILSTSTPRPPAGRRSAIRPTTEHSRSFGKSAFPAGNTGRARCGGRNMISLIIL